MAFNVPDLNYAFDALEPFIDAKTMEIHHDKHHGTYVTNLNKAIDGTEFASWPIERIVKDLATFPDNIRKAVRNNGGGHYNHAMFWLTIGPKAGGAPGGRIGEAITKDLGGFLKFKEAFTNAAMTRFGSGWAWLVVTPEKTLKVLSTPNQDSPLTDGDFPVLGIDVWEHAYYLKYQNRRAEYVEAFYNVIDWKAVDDRFGTALK